MVEGTFATFIFLKTVMRTWQESQPMCFFLLEDKILPAGDVRLVGDAASL